MRFWNDETIDRALETKSMLYEKLASYAPDEKLDSADIRDLMFILSQYGIELKALKADHKRNNRKR